MRKRVVALLLAFPLLGFVCDQSHSPAIQNNLAQQIEIKATYSNGQSFSQEVPSGARIWAPHEGLGFTRLEVTANGALLFDLDAAEFQRLQADFPPGQRILWVIERDGVHPIPLEN